MAAVARHVLSLVKGTESGTALRFSASSAARASSRASLAARSASAPLLMPHWPVQANKRLHEYNGTVDY